MATYDSPTGETTAGLDRDVRTVLVAGAAVLAGATLTFVGATDLVSVLYGYRPDAAPLAVLYGRAVFIGLLGACLLSYAVLRLGRAIVRG